LDRLVLKTMAEESQDAQYQAAKPFPTRCGVAAATVPPREFCDKLAV